MASQNRSALAVVGSVSSRSISAINPAGFSGASRSLRKNHL
jgi:hypothetical protein